MIRNPFPRWFETVCWVTASGCVVFVGIFWLLDLPGSPHGLWADIMCSVLILVAAFVCTRIALATHRDRAIWNERRP